MLRHLLPIILIAILILTGCSLPIPTNGDPTEEPTAPPTGEATDVVVETDQPIETAEPAETDVPTETEPPTETDLPIVTEAPVTEAPGETQAPTEDTTTEETETPEESETPTVTEVATATEAPNIGGGEIPLGDGTAEQNEVIYLLDGQLIVQALGGPPPERLYELPENAGPIREFALSPSGQYVAFIVNDQQLVVLDLTTGEERVITDRNSTTVSPLLWDPASSKLYFQRIVANSVAGAPPLYQFWETTPSGAPALILESEIIPDDNLTPVYALGNDQLAVLFGNETDGEILILDTFVGTFVPLGEDIGLWDVFNDGTVALLFDRNALGTGSEPLLFGDFGISSGATNVNPISTTEDGGTYRNATFAPNQFLIAALQETDEGTSLVTLSREPDGSFTQTALDNEPDLDDIAFSWLSSEDAILVERQVEGSEDSTLWIILLDGSAEIEIAAGSQPAIVGGS